MSIFKDIAVQLTTLSPIMDGREKTTIEHIRTAYPDGVTIILCDMVHTQEDGKELEYPILVCAEEQDKFFFGGLVMRKIIDGWTEHFGSLDALNSALVAEGGVVCKFGTQKTKDGKRNVTTVEVVS